MGANRVLACGCFGGICQPEPSARTTACERMRCEAECVCRGARCACEGGRFACPPKHAAESRVRPPGGDSCAAIAMTSVLNHANWGSRARRFGLRQLGVPADLLRNATQSHRQLLDDLDVHGPVDRARLSRAPVMAAVDRNALAIAAAWAQAAAGGLGMEDPMIAIQDLEKCVVGRTVLRGTGVRPVAEHNGIVLWAETSQDGPWPTGHLVQNRKSCRYVCSCCRRRIANLPHPARILTTSRKNRCLKSSHLTPARPIQNRPMLVPHGRCYPVCTQPQDGGQPVCFDVCFQ